MSTQARRLRVDSASPRAKSWLRDTRQAHVLYAFEQVVNLVNQEGDVLALVDAAIGNGPFSLVLTPGGFPTGVQADAQLLVFENGFWLADWLIDAEKARPWDPTPNWPSLAPPALSWANGIIQNLLAQHAKADSLARLILDPLASSPLPARIVQAAEQNVPLLYAGISDGDLAAITKAARGLAGMGPGLTPAGDDLLLGVMHGLWASKPAEEASRLSSAISSAAAPRTHALSAAWLTAGAHGEAAEPWHSLIDAIAAQNSAATEAAVMRILPTGHTSGADALGGFLGAIAGFSV
ncbi:MAG: DUF2877 domain-containing protein [Anaerolineales bacterium]